MKFQKNDKKEGTISLVEYFKVEEMRYALLSVEFRHMCRYAVYIEDEESCALEWVSEKREEGKKIFKQLVRGRVSVIHLPEIAEDLLKKCDFFV